MFTYHTPFAIGVNFGEVQWHREDVDVTKILCEVSTPTFQIGPIYGDDIMQEKVRVEVHLQ